MGGQRGLLSQTQRVEGPGLRSSLGFILCIEWVGGLLYDFVPGLTKAVGGPDYTLHKILRLLKDEIVTVLSV